MINFTKLLKILFVISVVFAALILAKINVFALTYCPGYNGNPATSCYCYPPWVDARVTGCSWGRVTNISAHWNGQNCTYCNYYVNYNDNGTGHQGYKSQCSGYNDMSLNISGYSLIGGVNVNPQGSSQSLTDNIHNTCQQPPTGYHDGADCSTGLWGWACQQNYYGSANRVDIYRDGPAGSGVYQGSATANQYRSDLNGPCGGNYYHAYYYPASSLPQDGVTHSYYIYAIDLSGQGMNPLLNNSPRSTVCYPPTPTPTPVNNATFVSQSVPTTMLAGQVYPVDLTFLNSGQTTWTQGGNYGIGSQNPQDNGTWGTGRVYLNSGDFIGPGAQKTFSFNVTAPNTPGVYNFQWQMLQEGVQWFGQLSPNVAVNVPSPTPTNTPTPTPITTPQNPYCDASGYIHNLNFGINDSNSWVQSWCGDVGLQTPGNNPLPPSGSPSCKTANDNIYTDIIDTTCINPGIFFSGSNNPTFGGGSASSTGWVVPNYAGENGLLPTSWQFLSDTAQINGITVNELSTVDASYGNNCGDYSNCMFDSPLTGDTLLPSGVYKVTTNNNTNPLKIGRSGLPATPITLGPASGTGKNYVFLVDGDMYIMGDILVPIGSTATFSVKGNIYIDKRVGQANTTSLNSDIQGFYSADKSVIVQSYQGIPQVNPILNPSFESGTGNPDSWGFYNDPVKTTVANPTALKDCTTSTDGSCSFHVKITKVDTPGINQCYWCIQIYENQMTFVSGQTYTIQFDAKANTNNVISVKAQHSNPYNAWFEDATPTLTNSWKTYTFTYSPPYSPPYTTNSDQNATFYFFLGKATGDIWIDNVKVTSNTTISRVQNGSFESGTAGNPPNSWNLWTNPSGGANGTLAQECDATTSDVYTNDCAAHIVTSSVNCPPGNCNYWWVNMAQSGSIPVFNGSNYTILFDAKAAAARPIYVYVQQGPSPWQTYGSFHPTLSTNWQTYAYQFQSPATDTAANLYFETGEQTGDVWIDNVSVIITAPTQYCADNGNSIDKRINITGSIVVSAAGPGGSLVNQRDLCNNDNCPSISLSKSDGSGQPTGLSYILNAPAFLKRRTHKWQEIAPKNAPTPTPTP